jgi:hypothetical protein
MRREPYVVSLFYWKCFLAAITSVTVASSAAAQSPTQPVAPTALHWTDPAFLPERQCRGSYAVEQLDRHLPRARIVLWLPGTRAVVLDRERRCLRVTVETAGDGRLAELVLRGVGIPRRAVLLRLAASERRSSSG